MFAGNDDFAVLALAVLIALTLGEPPMWAHPTVWMGRQLSFIEKRMPKQGIPALIAGVLIASVLPVAWCAAA